MTLRAERHVILLVFPAGTALALLFAYLRYREMSGHIAPWLVLSVTTIILPVWRTWRNLEVVSSLQASSTRQTLALVWAPVVLGALSAMSALGVIADLMKHR